MVMTGYCRSENPGSKSDPFDVQTTTRHRARGTGIILDKPMDCLPCFADYRLREHDTCSQFDERFIRSV